MTVHKIDNLFSEEELFLINSLVEQVKTNINKDDPRNFILSYSLEHKKFGFDKTLGRLLVMIDLPISIENKITSLVNGLSKTKLKLSHSMYAEYSGDYGTPYLPTHFDHDFNDMVIDFQLESNTSWDLGVDLKNYPLENNSALIFNANTHVHWRPDKIFNKGEYVKMLFFRFHNPENKSDYSYLNYSQDHKIFEEINEFKKTLKNI